MLKIVSVNWHCYQGRGIEYSNRLYDMVSRNLSEGTAGEFIIFTDDIQCSGYDERIIRRKLPDGLNGWFNKLYLFKDGLFNNGDRILYMDLDTLITGPLDDIAGYQGKFCILRDFYRPKGLQSSIMAWEANALGHIWESYLAEDCPQHDPGGDQAWIETQVENPDIWQKLYPGSFRSYKEDCRFGIPHGTRVCVFHGHPRPHEVKDGWVPQVWKVGGGTTRELIVESNVPRETIEHNIRMAMKRGSTWLAMHEPRKGKALIVAGGPSLKDELNSLKAHAFQGAEIFAVNNTINFLIENGIKPTNHVLLDARPENEKFLPPLGYQCRQYYASQCDPRVLDRATWALVLYHPYFDGIMDITGETDAAMIGGGTTAGLKAVIIAYVLGFREIHLYGFDSSYRDGENHAYKQPLNDNERVLDYICGDKTFKAAPWMIAQVEDFEIMAPDLVAMGCELHIHGDGLLPYRTTQMQSGVKSAPDQRADEILSRLPEGKVTGAEIGVFCGDLSKRLLGRNSNLTLYMVDSWGENFREEYKSTDDFHAQMSKEEQEWAYTHTKAVTSFAGNRAKIIRKASTEAAHTIPDGSLDFVFIDADHSYEGVKEDIEVWYPKLKEGGLLSGHDYDNPDFPKFGVMQAVTEFALNRSLSISLGENYTWFILKHANKEMAA